MHGVAARRVCVCVGSGGVGKTTVSAAIALALAGRGRRVVAVTIDPARRLADALGLGELAPEPQRVPGGGGPGELWAMTLDVKRTFDELVQRLARGDAQHDAILANPVYASLSGAIAGSQELSAMAKLDELHRSGRFDTVVLDTPPSRNALDFLDAPARLIPFVESRATRALLRPAGAATGLAVRGTGLALAALRRVTGGELLADLGEFLALTGELADGLAAQARAVQALLRDPGTAFVVVTSPERLAIDEAIAFHGRLERERLPVGALVVNRMHPLGAGASGDGAVALAAALGGDRALAAKALRTLHDLRAMAAHDDAAVRRLAGVTGLDPVLVPDLDREVHDLAALAEVGQLLFAPDAERAALLRGAAF